MGSGMPGGARAAGVQWGNFTSMPWTVVKQGVCFFHGLHVAPWRPASAVRRAAFLGPDLELHAQLNPGVTSVEQLPEAYVIFVCVTTKWWEDGPRGTKA